MRHLFFRWVFSLSPLRHQYLFALCCGLLLLAARYYFLDGRKLFEISASEIIYFSCCALAITILGAVCNIICISVNRWRMPVLPDYCEVIAIFKKEGLAMEGANLDLAIRMYETLCPRHTILTTNSKLSFLADRFKIDDLGIYSVGDLLMVVSTWVFCVINLVIFAMI